MGCMVKTVKNVKVQVCQRYVSVQQKKRDMVAHK